MSLAEIKKIWGSEMKCVENYGTQILKNYCCKKLNMVSWVLLRIMKISQCRQTVATRVFRFVTFLFCFCRSVLWAYFFHSFTVEFKGKLVFSRRIRNRLSLSGKLDDSVLLVQNYSSVVF